MVGFVVLKMSLEALRPTKVKHPENHIYIAEGDTLAEYGFPDITVTEGSITAMVIPRK